MSNRYTQIQGSAYNPMSLQEIMMAPTIQRRQHDDTNAQIQEYLAELAKVNPHNKHWEEAQAEKGRLMEELDVNATTLAQKGFSPDITSRLMKFNRDYQTSTSPMGKLGQFNAINEAAVRDSEMYRTNNINQGYSPDVVERRLNEELQDWEQNKPIYDEKGKVIAFQPRPMSKYKDHIETARTFFKDAGISSNDWATITSGLQKSDDGTYQYVGTTTTERAWAHNNKQLKAVEDFINSQIVNPNADLAKSLKDQYKTPEEAIADINAMMGIYRKDSTSEKDGYQMSYLSGGSGVEQPTIPGVFSHADGTFGFTESFDKIKTKAINTLENPNATPKERADARSVLNLTHEINQDLIDPESPQYDPEYANHFQHREELISQITSPNVLRLYETLENYGQVTEGSSFQIATDQLDTPEGHVRVLYNEKVEPGTGFYGQRKESIVLTREEYNELRTKGPDIFSKVRTSNKVLKDKQNSLLNEYGIEGIRYSIPYTQTSENTKDALNLLQGSSVNNLRPLHATVLNDKHRNESMALDEGEKEQLAGMIKGAKEGQFQNIMPYRTTISGDVGFLVEFRPETGSKLGGHKLDGRLVSVFIPIPMTTNPLTGTLESSMMNISKLPPEMIQGFSKQVDTRENSSTYNPEDLGQNAIPAQAVFGRNSAVGPNDKIDFLKKRGNRPSENYVVMTGQSGNDPTYRPLTWQSFIRYDILDQIPPNVKIEELPQHQQQYLRSLQTSGVWDVLLKTAEKHEVDGKTYRELYQLDTDRANPADFLRRLQYNEVRLESPHDTFEIRRLKNLEPLE
jgi:hypothetical protein